jgi:hypothetical protein
MASFCAFIWSNLHTRHIRNVDHPQVPVLSPAASEVLPPLTAGARNPSTPTQRSNGRFRLSLRLRDRMPVGSDDHRVRYHPLRHDRADAEGRIVTKKDLWINKARSARVADARTRCRSIPGSTGRRVARTGRKIWSRHLSPPWPTSQQPGLPIFLVPSVQKLPRALAKIRVNKVLKYTIRL